MKRTLCMAAVALVALALPVSPAGAAKPAQACSDVIEGTYSATTELGLPAQLTSAELVHLEQELAAPACAGVTYSVVVYDGDGGASGPLVAIGSADAPDSGTGTQADPQRFSIEVNDDDERVCIAGSTSGTTKKGATVVYDTMPDGVSCLLVEVNDPDGGGSSGWR